MLRPRVLFAWEMGANYGHIGKISRVASAISDRFEIFAAVREPAAFRQMAPDLGVHLLPAPFARARQPGPGDAQPASYSAILSIEGWNSPESAGALVEAWRELFSLVRPDILIVQAAPTALLAARGLHMKTVVLGSGYDNPPLAQPMPPFHPDRPGAQELAKKQETAALDCANQVLSRLKAPEAESVSDILTCRLSLLVAWPFTDHYGKRDEIQPDHPPYLGQITSTSDGADRDWAGRAGKRIFAYLRPGNPASAAAFAALEQMGSSNDIILAAPGMPAGEKARLEAAHIQVEDGPVRLAPLLPDCDLGVGHASSGTGSTFLMHGIPQIGLPLHSEQSMFARVLAESGACLGIEGHFGPDVVLRSARHIFDSSVMAARLNDLKAKIATGFENAPETRAKQLILETSDMI